MYGIEKITPKFLHGDFTVDVDGQKVTVQAVVGSVIPAHPNYLAMQSGGDPYYDPALIEESVRSMYREGLWKL